MTATRSSEMTLAVKERQTTMKQVEDEQNADLMARPALRRANVAQDPGLYRSGGALAGPRDRRQHSHLQSARRCRAEDFAGQKAGRAGPLQLALRSEADGPQRLWRDRE